MNINNIFNTSDNKLLFHYIRGSQAYGLNTPQSDTDTAGFFISNQNIIYGLKTKYVPQFHDDKNDNVFYELGEAFKLLIGSNPNMIEALFIPQKCILYKDKTIDLLLDNKKLFLSKKIYETFGGYAKSQIRKMIGLNKAIVNPVYTRLTPLDFCYTFYNQGSTKIHNWLEYRGLYEKYCGLINIPNMHNVFGLYYDFPTHIIEQYNSFKNFKEIMFTKDINKTVQDNNFINMLLTFYQNKLKTNFKTIYDIDDDFIIPIGYKGIINESETSNELRLSSIEDRFDKPICYMSYNQEGYTKHCNDFKRYKEWTNNRNPTRYEHNLKQNYDTKNAMHLIRLIHMCTETLNGQNLIIDRTDIDKDLLLNIKYGNVEYEQLKEMVEKDSQLMDDAFKNSKLNENINIDDINDLLVQIRKNIY